MKNVKLILTLLLLVNHTAFGQISSIKAQMLELFWYLPSHTEKFDIRTKLHSSNNFSNVMDSDLRFNNDALYANFVNNAQLNHLGTENLIMVFFSKIGQADQWLISSSYSPNEVNKCQLQLEQALSFLKNNSFRVVQSSTNNADEKLIGRGYSFYSSQNMINQRTAYASIDFKFLSYKNQYQLDIRYFPGALK